MLSFKHKDQHRLKEGDKMQKQKRSRSSGCRSSSLSSHHSDHQISNYQNYQLKIKTSKILIFLVDLQTKATFMQKRRYKMEEEMAAEGRVKIYEEESVDQKKPLETPAMAGIKEGDSRYSVMTKKQKYLD